MTWRTEGRQHSTVSPADIQRIDWADVAARARADVGDEEVERVSERVRILVLAASVRRGNSEGFRPKTIPLLSGDLGLD